MQPETCVAQNGNVISKQLAVISGVSVVAVARNGHNRNIA